jgi:dolichol-phosphate mannosyltransferase
MTGPVSVSVVLLARDEEATIADLVKKARPFGEEVLVVDGHSRDRTREAAAAAGARVVLDHGRGKGDGYRTAAAEARGEILVFLDADGSHDPADIPKLTAPIREGRLDFVIASRWHGGSDDVHPNLAHFVRDLGGNLLSMLISWRFNHEVTDCLNGFRAIRREKMLCLGLTANDFDIEHEMVMKALKQGLRVGEVGSHEYERKAGASKLPTFWKAHIFFIRLIREMW